VRKAGGITALIAGVFGVIAAFATLALGGVASAVDVKDASMVVMLGWGGVLFSFLAIILGAIAMGATSRWPGALLMICSIAGAILGGTLVAIFMVLAFVGGLLAVIGKGVTPPPARSSSAMTLVLAGVSMSIVAFFAHPAQAQDIQSIKLSQELGSILASEDFCGVSYDKAAIERFIEARVKANDMGFVTMLNTMTTGSRVQLQQMSEAHKVAHCAQIRRVSRSLGFAK
jgi:hypothetical protein